MMGWMPRLLLSIAVLSGAVVVWFRRDQRAVAFEATLVVVLLMSISAALLFWADKRKAQGHRRRTPERTLWTFVYLGGAVGAWFGMRRWRHKTRTTRFRYGVPSVAIVQLVGLVAWALAVCA